jgi:hypothetical protein
MINPAIIVTFLTSNAERTTIAVVSFLNLVVLFVNLYLVRKVRRRYRAVIRSEERASGGPVTSTMTARFAETTSRKH